MYIRVSQIIMGKFNLMISIPAHLARTNFYINENNFEKSFIEIRSFSVVAHNVYFNFILLPKPSTIQYGTK